MGSETSNQEIISRKLDSSQKFYEFYAEASESDNTVTRFKAIRKTVLRSLGRDPEGPCNLTVADIGCGAGTQSMIWARHGSNIHSIDVNEKLVELARKRAIENDLDIEFFVGSATSLPWEDNSIDVCLVPELLEHIPDWQECLDECCRILRQGGVLFITTSNKLCPKQEEFYLPLYSWYPEIAKRHYERLAKTTRPDIAGHAEFPAINWFTFYTLRSELAKRGLTVKDRFDVMDVEGKNRFWRFVIRAVRGSFLLRFLGQVLTPYTLVVGSKS